MIKEINYESKVNYQYYSSTRMALALNNPQRLKCHSTKKKQQTQPNYDYDHFLKILYICLFSYCLSSYFW